MLASQLKSDIHQFVDAIDNPKILEQMHGLLHGIIAQNNSIDFWDTMTDLQKQEIDAALKESESAAHLVSNEMAIANAKK